MAAGKYTLRSGKLYRPRGKNERFRQAIRPGDRFDPTKEELVAFSDLIITWPAYVALIGDKVEEIEGDTTSPPTDKPEAKRKSRAKKAVRPETEPESEPETELIE